MRKIILVILGHNSDKIAFFFVPNWYTKKQKAMLVISSREFRDKQKSYLDKVDEGIEILIRRGKNRSYKVVPVTEDDTLMSKEEFFARIDRARRQAAEGKIRTVRSKEELLAYLDSL